MILRVDWVQLGYSSAWCSSSWGCSHLRAQLGLEHPKWLACIVTIATGWDYCPEHLRYPFYTMWGSYNMASGFQKGVFQMCEGKSCKAPKIQPWKLQSLLPHFIGRSKSHAGPDSKGEGKNLQLSMGRMAKNLQASLIHHILLSRERKCAGSVDMFLFM